MGIENLGWLGALIAGHPRHQVVGRTRLQKTVWLLQRLGLPTNYSYSLHFYGPYSEELKTDIGLAEDFGLISEEQQTAQDGTEYFLLHAEPSELFPSIEPFRRSLEILAQKEPVVLELAATYDAFRKMGLDHQSALESLRAKKGDKCLGGREVAALELLRALGLLAD